MDRNGKRDWHRSTVDRRVVNNGKGKSARMDLGLELLRLATLPGAAWKPTEIAAWCGCSNEAIRMIERRALRKVRRAMGEGWKP
jgi:hypothetical protein